MNDGSESADPEFIVEDIDDLEELLTRAGNLAERDLNADVLAAEFRQARDFVADELADEPELVTDGGRDLGVACDVDDCETRVVGLEDGWEVNRGTVCQDCLDYRDRHNHWPDEDPDICVECRLDEGAIRHECDEAAVDAVILNPGSDCDFCGFKANVATDGGVDQSQSALANLQELDEPWRDEQLIRYLYHEKKLSGMRMASYLGCSVGTANRWIRRHGITRREHVRVPFYTHSDKGTECWAHSYKGDTDFVYVHRLVMIAEYGIDAVVKNDVHHINEIRWDNRPENLTLMTRGEHTVHHSSKVKGLDRVRLAEIYENGTMSCRDLASHVDHDITPGTVLYVHGQFYGGEAA